MSDLHAFVRANGWSAVLPHAVRGMHRQVRDRLIARHLKSPGFRAGAAPRVLGMSHMAIGADFHARDALWLEAVLLYEGQSFSPQLVVGPAARLSDSVHIACLHQVTIGAHLLSGSRVLISDHTHGRYDDGPASGSPAPNDPAASDPAIAPARRPLFSPAPVVIGDNVWLGDGVAVLAGAHIGDGCVIGTNAVVTGTIPPGTVAVGAPARPIRRWEPASRRWLPLRPVPGGDA